MDPNPPLLVEWARFDAPLQQPLCAPADPDPPVPVEWLPTVSNESLADATVEVRDGGFRSEIKLVDSYRAMAAFFWSSTMFLDNELDRCRDWQEDEDEATEIEDLVARTRSNYCCCCCCCAAATCEIANF